jgi:HTH-type transcriptional regulator/antitoxin HigA
MQIIALRTLRLFWQKHPQAERAIKAWYAQVSKAEWRGPGDVKAQFGTTVDFIADNRLMFDLSGNKYRLIVHVAYPFGRVLVKFIGTHREIRPYRPGDRSMNRPLRSEADYDEALRAIARYFEDEPRPGTPEADAFDLLALLIADYERRHWPIDPPDPVDAIRYRMETAGYSQADLGRLLGSRQRASDILQRKRRLTMRMAAKLHREWGIPAEALLSDQLQAGSRT